MNRLLFFVAVALVWVATSCNSDKPKPAKTVDAAALNGEWMLSTFTHDGKASEQMDSAYLTINNGVLANNFLEQLDIDSVANFAVNGDTLRFPDNPRAWFQISDVNASSLTLFTRIMGKELVMGFNKKQ